MNEYLRPWKLVTLAIGLGLLIWGSYAMPAPDWDIPVSFIMAIATYLTAGWSVRVVLFRQWRKLPLAIFYWVMSVDLLYAGYWLLTDRTALMMRDVNFPASTVLFLACGLLWAYNGSLKDISLGNPSAPGSPHENQHP